MAIIDLPVTPTQAAIDSDNSFATSWEVARGRLLSILLETTGCNCAIIRRSGSKAEELILEDHRFNPSNNSKDEHDVPLTKTIRYWGGNAFESCFVQHYPEGSLRALPNFEEVSRELTDKQKAFLNEVRWRVSFPIQVGDDIPRLAILLSYEVEKPAWLTRQLVLLAWLGSQLTVSQQFASTAKNPIHSAVVEACRATSVFSLIQPVESALAALFRILCSGRGLGWNRAWLLRRSEGNFVCEVCAGGRTFEDWVGGAKFAGDTCQTLSDEIAFELLDNARLRDSMTEAFRGLRVPETFFHSVKPHRNGGENWFTIPVEFETNEWAEYLDRTASTKGVQFDSSSPYYWCRLNINKDEFVLVLSHWQSLLRPHQNLPVVETGATVAIAAEIISAHASQSESTDDEASASESISGFLSFAGIEPITISQLRRSRIRAMRKLYQHSEDYRFQVQSEVSQLHEAASMSSSD